MPRLENRLLHEGIRRYERNVQYQILCHLDSLNTQNSRNAWTTRISPGRTAEFAERAKNPPLEKRAPVDVTYRNRKNVGTFERVGSTVAVKDNIVTSSCSGLPTSAASNILRGYLAPEPATIISLLEEAGLMVLGKTNMDEFGMGSHSQHSAFGPVANSRNPLLSVGGSSGGSAELVARGVVHYGIGTDTGGSVRLPASYLNIVGFKPSYGCISRYGVVPYANSLDTVGLLATSCLDLDPLFRVLSQPDPKDATCLSAATRARMQQIRTANNAQHDEPPAPDHLGRRPQKQRRPLRIGVPREYNIAELQNGVREAWIRSLNLLAAQGHTIVPISLPSTRHALSAYYVIAPAEASSNLAKYDGVRYGRTRDESAASTEEVLYSSHRGQHFGDEVRRRILLGAYSLSAGAMDNFFLRAQKVRRLVQNDFNRVFRAQHPLLPHQPPPNAEEGVDYIVCPTAPTFPPKVNTLVDDEASSPLEAYANDVLTVPASLAGLPAISVPAPPPQDALGLRPERAIGIQVIGQFGTDLDLITFATRNLEYTQDWSLFNNEKPRKKF